MYSSDTDALLLKSAEGVSWRTRPRGFFDPRNIGLVHDRELDRRTFRDLREGFSEAYRVIRGKRGDSGEPAIVTLINPSGKGSAFRELTLDPNQGFVPILMEIRTRDKIEETWTDVMYTAKTEWQKIFGVSVPKNCQMRMLWGDKRIRTLSFEWVEVNGEEVDKAFSWQALPLPDSTVIGDGRLDPSNVIVIKDPTRGIVPIAQQPRSTSWQSRRQVIWPNDFLQPNRIA